MMLFEKDNYNNLKLASYKIQIHIECSVHMFIDEDDVNFHEEM